MSGGGTTSLPVKRSASVTTGQGVDAFGNWMARGLSNQSTINRLGNNRAPAPTCNIPLARGDNNVVPTDNEQSWTTIKVADSMGGESYLQQASAYCSAMATASGSLESTHDRIKISNGEVHFSDTGKDGSQPELSDFSEEDDEQDAQALTASRPAYKRGRKGKERKKVGRPIAYRGDPNAPELTDVERRRIKRRIANRESARRVRHKRQEELEDMQIKMEQIMAHNMQLQQHIEQSKTQKDILSRQLEDLVHKNEGLTSNNKQLTIEIQALRQSLQLKMSALEDELDKRANEAGDAVIHSAFGSSAAQPSLLSYSYSPTHPVPEMSQIPETKTSQSGALDWLPSLNLDDPRAMDMLNCLLEDPNSA